MLKRLLLLGGCSLIAVACSASEEDEATATDEAALRYHQGMIARCNLWATVEDLNGGGQTLPGRLSWSWTFTAASDPFSNLPALGFSCTEDVPTRSALPECPNGWSNSVSTVCQRGTEKFVLTPSPVDSRQHVINCGGLTQSIPTYIYRTQFQFSSSATTHGTGAVRSQMQNQFPISVPQAGAFVNLDPLLERSVSLSLGQWSSEALMRDLGSTNLPAGVLPAFDTIRLPSRRPPGSTRVNQSCVQNHLPPNVLDGRSYHLCMACE